MQLKRGLGRGLESLIPPPVIPIETKETGTRKVPISSILPNRMQPRTVFDEEKIRELSDSIRENGVIQPLIVSPKEDGRFELIAGERRLRAARLAGLLDVPVVIKEVDDENLLAISIIENIQREDLNPIEEALAYRELTEEFALSQEDVAKKVGKSRSAVTNCIRLLTLPKIMQDDVASGRYSAGHARAVLPLENLHERLKIRERLISDMPTVRDVEKMVGAHLGGNKRKRESKEILPQTRNLADTMKGVLGTKVEIAPKGSGGKIVIEYYSAQDLDRIYRKIVA